jgi:hypothetical protein
MKVLSEFARAAAALLVGLAAVRRLRVRGGPDCCGGRALDSVPAGTNTRSSARR